MGTTKKEKRLTGIKFSVTLHLASLCFGGWLVLVMGLTGCNQATQDEIDQALQAGQSQTVAPAQSHETPPAESLIDFRPYVSRDYADAQALCTNAGRQLCTNAQYIAARNDGLINPNPSGYWVQDFYISTAQHRNTIVPVSTVGYWLDDVRNLHDFYCCRRQ